MAAGKGSGEGLPAAARGPPLSREARRQEAKAQLATTAQQLLQDPHKHIAGLRALLELLRDPDAQVGSVGSVGVCRGRVVQSQRRFEAAEVSSLGLPA